MTCKILEFMDKDKGGFMLDKDSLARVHREEHGKIIVCIHNSYAYRESVSRVQSIDCIALYRMRIGYS